MADARIESRTQGKEKAERGNGCRVHARLMPFDRLRRKSGAGEGIRTLDPNLGKVVLYP